MNINQAKNLLIGLKRQVNQREVYEALDIAIEALAWKELDENIWREVDEQNKRAIGG